MLHWGWSLGRSSSFKLRVCGAGRRVYSPVMSSNAVKSDKSSEVVVGFELEDVPVAVACGGLVDDVGWSFAGDREGQGSSMDIAGVGEDAVCWTWRLVVESWEAYAAHPNRSMNAIVSLFFMDFSLYY